MLVLDISNPIVTAKHRAEQSAEQSAKRSRAWSGAERGAQRAENQVEQNEVRRGHCRKNDGAEQEVAERKHSRQWGFGFT